MNPDPEVGRQAGEMYCPSCGKVMNSTTAACPHCGLTNPFGVSTYLTQGANPPMAPFARTAVAPTDPLAIASFVLGIMAIPMSALAAIPAVVCGHMALKRIGASNGAREGTGMAKTGLVLGYIGIGVFTIILALSLAMQVVMLHAFRQMHFG